MLIRTITLALFFWVPMAVPGAVPSVDHWQHATGVDIYFVPADDLEIVDIRVVFDAGGARDGDLPGLASLTGHMLKQGADGLSADQIGAAFEDKGARFGVSVGRDSVTVELRSLNWPETLWSVTRTMASLLQKPDFPDDALERERRRLLVAIKQREQSPAALADEAFYAALYPNHPYGTLLDGTTESVSAMRTDDLERFHRRHYTRAAAKLIVVGAVNRATVEKVAEVLFSGLPAGEALPALPPVSMPEASYEYIPYPSAQTHVLMGMPVLRMDSPDRLPLFIAGRILGGGMVSRLFRSVREERGLAYSVNSYFHPMARAGPFIIRAQTQVEKKEEMIRLLRQELSEFARQGPSEQELDDAKSNLTGGFPLNISDNAKMANYLVWMAFYGLPPDYLDSFISRVEQVTLEQVRESFRRHIVPDRLILIEVGDKGKDAAAR